MEMNINYREQIEIFFHGRSLLKGNSLQIISYKMLEDEWVEYGKTEIITDNPNPNFKKTLIIDFIFEEQQYLKFELLSINSNQKSKNKLISNKVTSVGELLGMKNQILIFDLDINVKKTGKLIIRCDKYSKINEVIKLKLMAENVKNMRKMYKFWVKSSPFLRIYKFKI